MTLPFLQFGDSYSGFRDPYLSLDNDPMYFYLLIVGLVLLWLFIRLFTKTDRQASTGCIVIVVLFFVWVFILSLR